MVGCRLLDCIYGGSSDMHKCNSQVRAAMMATTMERPVERACSVPCMDP